MGSREERVGSVEDYSDPSSRPTKSHVSRRMSRCSSVDSSPSQPRSPFQCNPLLTAHDYAKSPLMEGVDEERGGLEEDWRDIEDEEDEEEEEGEEEGREDHSEDEASSREESRLDDVIPAE